MKSDKTHTENTHFDVVDENGNKLGMINTGVTGFSKFSLVNSDYSLLLTIHNKFFSFKEICEAKDTQGNIIGKLKKKGYDVEFEDVNGKNLQGTIPLTTTPCGIYDDDGNEIASVARKTDTSTFKEIFGTKQSEWILKINNSFYSRITLLGFFLAMYRACYTGESSGF